MREKITELLKLKDYYYIKIDEILQQINDLERAIVHNCDHSWRRDYSAMFDDQSKYYCPKCGIYKNELPT